MTKPSLVPYAVARLQPALTRQPGVTADAASPAPEAPGASLEDVAVTDDGRSRSIEDLPASALAITSAGRGRADVLDFDGPVRTAPSLTVTKTNRPSDTSTDIGGIGTYAYSISTELGVVVVGVVDDISRKLHAAAFIAMADVAPVEVLGGPRSRLFSGAAPAVPIKMARLAPTDRLSARAETFLTDDGEPRYQGRVSAPPASTLKAQISGCRGTYPWAIVDTSTDIRSGLTL